MAEEDEEVQYHIEIQEAQDTISSGEMMVVLELDGQEMPESVAQAIAQLAQSSSQPWSMVRVTKATREHIENLEMREHHTLDDTDATPSPLLKEEAGEIHQQMFSSNTSDLSQEFLVHEEGISSDNDFTSQAATQTQPSTEVVMLQQQVLPESHLNGHEQMLTSEEQSESFMQIKVEEEGSILYPEVGLYNVHSESKQTMTGIANLGVEVKESSQNAAKRIIVKDLAQLEELKTGKLRCSEFNLDHRHAAFMNSVATNNNTFEKSGELPTAIGVANQIVNKTDHGKHKQNEEKLRTGGENFEVENSKLDVQSHLTEEQKRSYAVKANDCETNLVNSLAQASHLSSRNERTETEEKGDKKTIVPGEHSMIALKPTQMVVPKSCSICSFECTNDLDMGRHLKTVHKEQWPFACSICHKSFVQELSFQIHSLIHIDITAGRSTKASKTFISCPHCTEAFTTTRRMLRHVEKDHPKLQAYYCEDCKVTVKSEAEFHEHVQSVAHLQKVRKAVTCPVCKVSCQQLAKHLTSNHPNYCLYKCEMCGYSCKTQSKMKYHQMTHLSEKPFQCPHCHKCLKSRVSWSRHVKNHNPNKRFSCSQCNFTSNDSYEFKRHVQCVHSKSMYYDCKFCNLSFVKACDLKLHAMSEHKCKDNHFCRHCKFSCETRAEMKKHCESHTGAYPYVCDKCAFSTFLKNHLERHQAIHSDLKPFKCSECNYSCREKVNLQKHMVIHKPEKPFACSMCSYRCKLQSQLNNHIRIVHSSLRPFACSVCSYTCKTASNLKKHQWIHQGYKPHACRFCPYVTREKNKLTRHEKFKHKIGTEGEVSSQQRDKEVLEEEPIISCGKATEPRDQALQIRITPQHSFDVEQVDLSRGILKASNVEHSSSEYDVSPGVGKTIFSSRFPIGQLQENSSDTDLPFTLAVHVPKHQSFIIL